MLFGDNLAIQLMLLAFFLRQRRVAPLLKMGKPAFEAARASAVEPDRAARKCREKAPVVADDHQCSASCIEVTPSHSIVVRSR